MISIDRVKFTPAPIDQTRTGLVGYVSAVVNDTLRIDGVCVRRTMAGSLCLSWPERRDGSGRRHALIQPISDAARLRVEEQVLAAIHHQLEDLG